MKDDLSWLPWALAAGGAAAIAYGLITDTKIVIGNSGPLVVKGVGNGQYMRADAAEAFNTMVQQAAADGITLVAGSAFRSVIEQSVLYAEYVARLFTAPTVAKPGTSNHGNGIAVDVAVNPTTSVHYGTQEFAWLQANGGRFGFDWSEGQSVNEPWHWDFVG